MSDPTDGPRVPPRAVERLLRRCLPVGTVGDSIVGDAREEFHHQHRRGHPMPRVWYCLHALAVAGPYLREATMDILLKDLKFGARSLARQPGSAVISVLILALGIGLSTFMFSLVYGVFFRGLDVPQPERLAVLAGVNTREANQNLVPISSQDFLDYRERLRSFEALAASTTGTVNLADNEGPERFAGVFVTANVFDVLGVTPVMGRTFVEGEDRPGLPPTVVLGYHVWRDRYGSSPDVIGRSVRVNGEQGSIVGVMPEGFRWPSAHDVWVTLDDDPLATARREGDFYSVTGRLADGVAWDQAAAEVARVAAQLEQEHPEANEALSARLLTVSESQNGDEITLIFGAMMVAVLFVLAVACANVANLLLARAATRTREAGVRVAMGAGRMRVVVPFLAEALVLAVAGAVLGTGLAYWGVGLFDAATHPDLTGRPYFMVFQVDLPILLWVVAVTGLTALLAGVAPALQVSRADVNLVLKDESRGTSSLHMGRVTRALVLVEVALSVALLVGAGLMTKSIVQLRAHELPFDSEAYVTARAGLFDTDYPDRADRQAFWEDVERRVTALPEVAAAALSSSVPADNTGTQAIRLDGHSYDDRSAWPRTHVQIVSAGYFALLDAEVLEGRVFDTGDRQENDPVAVVNRSFQERFWPGESAVGRRFRTGVSDTIPFRTIVGVVSDLQMQGFQPTGSPSSTPDGFYVPFTQADPSFMSLVARPASGPPVALVPALREVVRSIDADLPLYDVKTIDEQIYESSWFYQVFGSVFILFGVAALFMASVGLYGVLSFSVSRRTQEMGIRMALGAGAPAVTRLVLRQGTVQVGLGLLVGLVLAAGVSSGVAALMFNVNPRDPSVFAAVVGVIVAVSLVASLVPARRATRVDPMVALRSE